MTKRRFLRALPVLALVVLAVPAVFVYRVYRPPVQDLPLPPDAIDVGSAEGRSMLARAASADYGPLSRAFAPQIHGSFCGVASAVDALRALGFHVTQETVFDERTERVQTWSQAFFGGLTLDELGAFLAAAGAVTLVTHAEPGSVDAFRAAAQANLARRGDFLLVNYDRRVLHEEGSGHISPLAAYDAASDSVLVLDTASYKYPPHWVPLASLHRAMATADPSSGARRGWVEVSGSP